MGGIFERVEEESAVSLVLSLDGVGVGQRRTHRLLAVVDVLVNVFCVCRCCCYC